MRPMALDSADIRVEGFCEEWARVCLQKVSKAGVTVFVGATKIIVHKELGWHTMTTIMCQQTKIGGPGINQQRSLPNEKCTHNGILPIQKPGFVTAEEPTMALSHTWYDLIVVSNQT